MSFGTVLQRIRRDKKMTQKAVAMAIDMDYTYFSRLENDRFDSKPTRDTVLKIAGALGCTPVERAELLTAAGRIEADMESVVRSMTRPDLKPLYRKVSKLSPEQAKQLDEIMRARFGRQGKRN